VNKAYMNKIIRTLINTLILLTFFGGIGFASNAANFDQLRAQILAGANFDIQLTEFSAQYAWTAMINIYQYNGTIRGGSGSNSATLNGGNSDDRGAFVIDNKTVNFMNNLRFINFDARGVSNYRGSLIDIKNSSIVNFSEGTIQFSNNAGHSGAIYIDNGSRANFTNVNSIFNGNINHYYTGGAMLVEASIVNFSGGTAEF
jgi:hypothetical protein